MKVRYLGPDDLLTLLHGKVYEAKQESGFYRIVDETDEDYLYPTEDFEIVEK